MTDMTLSLLKLNKFGEDWQPTTTDIYVVREGSILAVEIDANNRDKIDSSYTFKNVVSESNPEATDRFFVIDDKENLLHYQQNESDGAYSFEIISERSLSEIKGFSPVFSQVKHEKFARIVVTERVITINETNFNMQNGHSWQLSGRALISADQEYEFEENEEEEKERDMHLKNQAIIDVDSTQNIPWTTRVISTVSVQEWSEQQ